ncbi:hypothetical protein ACKWTF_009863 [Chironomus riparius]
MNKLSEREEYEMSLYGFSIKDFKHENFQFFRNQLNKSMQFITSKFMDQIKDAKVPDTLENLTNSLNQVEFNILESTKSNIQYIVNDDVEKLLNIPENVILPTDRAQTKQFSSDCIYELEKECDELGAILLQNASFIKHLSAELNSYEIQGLLEHEDKVLLEGEKFLSLQLLEPDVLDGEEEPNVSFEDPAI